MIDKDKYKDKKIIVSVDEDSKVDEMSYYEFSRWLSLIEAVHVIDTKANQLNLPSTDSSWIKPIALGKYVNERTESMLHEITNEGTI